MNELTHTGHPMSPDERVAVADDLARAARNAREAQRQLDRDVAEARQRGLSWSQIGDALGVSKQAAQQRYRSTRVSLDDQPLPEASQ